MKKIFTLLSIALCTTAFAQSFSVYRMNNSAQTGTVATFSHGTMWEETTAATTNTSSPSKNEFFVKLVNNSANTVTLSVLRTVVYANPALKLDNGGSFPDSYFCFGYNCFGSSVNTPPTSADYCVLGPNGTSASPYDNSKANGTPFVIDLVEGTIQGYYLIKYKVYNVNDASDTLTFSVRYNAILGVKEIANTIESVSDVFPNPSTNVANLSLTLTQESPVKIQVYNSLGVVVYSANDHKLAGKNKLSVDCANLSSGLYFVAITAGESKITKRLVVNK